MKISDFINCPVCGQVLQNDFDDQTVVTDRYMRKICKNVQHCSGDTTAFCAGARSDMEIAWLYYSFPEDELLISYFPRVYFEMGKINHDIRVNARFYMPDPYDIETIKQKVKIYRTFS